MGIKLLPGSLNSGGKFGSSSKQCSFVQRKLGRAKSKWNPLAALEQFQFIMKADQKALTVPDIYHFFQAQLGAGQKSNAISTLESAIKLNEKTLRLMPDWLTCIRKAVRR